MEQYCITFNEVNIPVVTYGNGWIVVEKPCGISIHNDPGKDLCSITVEFLNQNNQFAEKISYDRGFGVSPVNRIDRDTSGIILLGLQKEITAFFSRQFEQRSVVKKYVAIVHGHPESEGKELIWNSPLSPKAGGRKNPAGAGSKVACTTKYRVLDRSPHYSLIECELLTGRKHQIRRHAKLNKTPITGDKKYGSPRSIKYLEENCDFTRLGLHSQSLAITTPEGERVVVESQTPSEFFRLIESDK